MRTALALLILGLTATSVMCDCDGDNFYSLLAFASGAVATSGSGTAVGAATKCGFTATTTPICVTEADVDTKVQAYLNTVKTALETAAGDRDEYIIQQRGKVIEALVALRKINEFEKDATLPDAASVFAGEFIDYAATIADNFTAIVENFDDYQTERAKCMSALLKSQAAIVCNSIVDPISATAYTLTTDSENALLSDDLIGEISTECYTYLEYSERQSALILTSVYSSGLSLLASAIEKFANNDATGAGTDLKSAVDAMKKISASTVAYEKPSQRPTGCTSAATCESFVEDTILGNKGLIDQDVAIQGGQVVTLSFPTLSRVLREGKERRLDTDGLVATLAQYSGFSTTFDNNPGQVDNTKNANSALRNGIVACAIAALALVF